MLGMTLGALNVYLKKEWFSESSLTKDLSRFTWLYSLGTPLSLLIICLIPMVDRIEGNPLMPLMSLLVISVAAMIPFYFAGIAITGVLTRSKMEIGKIYAFDLFGAASGCIIVLLLLNIFDPMSTILLSSAMGALASMLYSGDEHEKQKKISFLTLMILLVVSLANSFLGTPLRPLVVKQQIEAPVKYEYEKWNTYSRVTVFKTSPRSVYYWGQSPVAPRPTEHNVMKRIEIDAGAATFMHRMSKKEDVDFLRFDVTNIGHHLELGGTACIIGVGGGRDIQSAMLFNYDKYIGVEMNPLVYDLVQNRYDKFVGVAKDPRVKIVVDEARSYFTHSEDTCNWLQMSLVDTNAAVAAGSFTLSENALYTTDAFKVFYRSLKDDGVFSVSRINKVGFQRLLSIAMTTMFELGIKNPSEHLIAIGSINVSTMLFSKKPFRMDHVEKMKKAAEEYKYNFLFAPGIKPKSKILQKIVLAKDQAELDEFLGVLPVNWTAPTDDNPYFFNMLRFGESPGEGDLVVDGNNRATKYLTNLILALLILGVVTLILPLLIHEKGSFGKAMSVSIFKKGAVYFSLIGMGFMFVEISMIQRFGVYLGHPVYSLAILLFTIILSTGLGSLISEKIHKKLNPQTFGLIPVVTSLLIVSYIFLTSELISSTINLDIIPKIIITILVMIPLGICLGLFFPMGMRVLKGEDGVLQPWYFSLNGVAGVLGSCLTVLISIYFGISTSMYLAALCYIILYFPISRVSEHGRS